MGNDASGSIKNEPCHICRTSHHLSRCESCDCSLFEVVDQVAPGLGAEYAAVYRGGVHVQQHLWYLNNKTITFWLLFPQICVSVEDPYILYGSGPLTKGSGSESCYFRPWHSRAKKTYFVTSFSTYYFLKVHVHFSKIKSHKEVSNSRNLGFS